MRWNASLKEIWYEDICEASYFINIKICRENFWGILGLSQGTYINKVLKRFNMKNGSLSVAPILKGDNIELDQFPKNNLEQE